jgi:hypothetical protein
MQDEMKRLGGADMYWICDKVIEIMGGSSLMETSPIQRYYRDARTTSYLMTPMESRRLRVGRHITERDAALDEAEEMTMPWEDFADHGYRNVRGLFDINVMQIPEPAQKHVLSVLNRAALEENARSSGRNTVTLDVLMEQLKKGLAEQEIRSNPNMKFLIYNEHKDTLHYRPGDV